jgi:N-acetylglutamate synthase-like GNAT family acetyltransferase
MSVRRARLSDAAAIYRLIGVYAQQGLLLARTEDEIRANISHFVVHKEKGRLAGCLSLEPYTAGLAEIRSVAVAADARGRGIGPQLVEFALDQARQNGIARVFAVTHATEFFERLGFAAASREALAEKIERDCRKCAKRRSCELVAVVATVLPERVMLPILDESATPVSAA